MKSILIRPVRGPAVRLRAATPPAPPHVQPGRPARRRQGAGRPPGRPGDRGRGRDHLRVPDQGRRGRAPSNGCSSGPKADLNSRAGQQARARYFGPPATWAANDGSARHRHAGRRGPRRRRQHPAAAGQGQPGDRHGRDERYHLHPARGHAAASRRPAMCDAHGRRAQGDRHVPGRLHLLEGGLTPGAAATVAGTSSAGARMPSHDAPFDYESAVMACARGERFALALAVRARVALAARRGAAHRARPPAGRGRAARRVRAGLAACGHLRPGAGLARAAGSTPSCATVR